MFKRYISFVLLFCFTMTNVGFVVTNHYCSGKVHKRAISMLGEDLSCGMEEEEIKTNSKGFQLKSNCCKNRTQIVKVKDSFESCTYSFDQQENLNFTFYFLTSCYNAATCFKSIQVLKPPEPIISIPINILFQTFLI